MKRSNHHVGEWELGQVVVELPGGLFAHVPFLARDGESAERCVRVSLWLLGFQMAREIVSREDAQ